jgi:hypothetical protein
MHRSETSSPTITRADLQELWGVLRNAESWALNIQRQGTRAVDQAEMADAILRALRIVERWEGPPRYLDRTKV